ncbi:hypothetical protein EGI22_11860 [Lacihabitans sp. LS3-19]|uniref:hypothetical protein n=1 Tax=Lacihabitans sp. LS3-19 TaxID=2487335 RepID=UPI0020CFA6D1|nr:hypothetical protein [Lacihabitans sp. LS3-19]MCP9768611.1 hypothetical protein [Lacihabitans sp. LS3-19]
MKTTKSILIVALLAISSVSFAQFPKALAKPAETVDAVTDSTEMMLDNVLSLSAGKDNAATAMALTKTVESIEKSSESSSGEFKDKLLGQVGNLKKLIPLISGGGVQSGVLQKAIAMVKMALGANKLSSLMGGKSLVGQASALTGNLGMMKSGLSLLGGSSAASGGSLISTAMSSVNLLKTGGAAAEPKVRDSLGGVLKFAKGIL